LDDRAEEVRLTAATSLAALKATPPLSAVMQRLVESSHMHSLLLQSLIDSIAPGRPKEVLDLAKGKTGKNFIRPMALTALGKAGHLELGEDVAGFIDDADPEVRAAALASVASLGYFGAKEKVKRALDDPVHFVRVRAIAAARALELHDLTADIARLLNDDNWWVRFRAGEALAALGHPVPQPIDRVIEFRRGSGRGRSGQRGVA
jgi:HEAT repeat protein